MAAINRREAERDLHDKIVLESQLRTKWAELNRKVTRSVVASLATTSTLPDVRGITVDGGTPILEAHYQVVSDKFKDRIRGQLPPDVAMTDEEARQITASLLVAFNVRAREQAEIIAETNVADAQRGVLAAASERERLAQERRVMGLREFALAAGAVAGFRMLGRLGSVASLETQAPAEKSKITELRELLGLDPDNLRASESSDVVKEWVTQGDSRVRGIHLAVDSVQVLVTDAFTVGGERLMQPGDTSLGATARNVVHCRCSALFDVQAVVSARQRGL